LKEKRNTGNAAVINKVTGDVIQLWRKTSIPTVQWQTVAKRIRRLIDTGSRLNRSKTSTKQMGKYKLCLPALFDICSCMCKLTIDGTLGEFLLHCKCPREKKVPQDELNFPRSANKP